MLFNNRFASLVVLGLLAAGCSTFTPYDSDFSCKNDDHGQCMHPEDAYNYAVRSGGSNVRNAGSSDGARIAPSRPVASEGISPYEGYQQASYRELARLIDRPATPMITPPKTIRTLILPYANDESGDLLFMPRFVYSILEGPRFVMGDYLQDRPETNVAEFLSQGLIQPASAQKPEGGE